MRPLTVTLWSEPYQTRLLASWNQDDCLRAVLPTHPVDPRAPIELLESVAAWVGKPAHVAIAADGQGRASCGDSLFGGALLPDDTARLRFAWMPDRRPLRLRGPGDFREVYRVHGRAS
jgi:hypothetical protein